MKTLFCLFACVSLVYQGYCQSGKTRMKEMKELSTYTEQWSDGLITLTDKTELNGLIKYDDRNGVLSYQNGDDSRSFSPRTVMSFEFFDQNLGKQRLFYTLEYKDPKIDIAKLYFFEVLKEYKNFAVLSKTDPLEVQTYSQSSGLNGMHYTEQTAVSQTSTVFLMNSSGSVVPYIRQIEGKKITKVAAFSKDRNKLIAPKNKLAEFVGAEVYERLVHYAKQNELSFDYREEFLKILAYYDQIQGE
jgi:hypothetical protein